MVQVFVIVKHKLILHDVEFIVGLDSQAMCSAWL